MCGNHGIVLLRCTSEYRYGRALGYNCREVDRAKRALSAFGPRRGNRAETAGEKAEAEAKVKVDREVPAGEVLAESGQVVVRRTVSVTSTPRRGLFAMDQIIDMFPGCLLNRQKRVQNDSMSPESSVV